MKQKINTGHLCALIATIIISLGITSSFANTGAENQQKVVRLGVPTGFKKLFPEADGVVWTDTLFKVIFERAGYRVETLESPAKRTPFLLVSQKVDSFLSANESLGSYRDKLLQAKYPGTSLAMFIYYNAHGDWKPSWPPDAEFKRKRGVSKQSESSLRADEGLNVLQVTHFDSCIKMVNAGRADYWIDNITGYTNSTPGLMRVPTGEFAYREIFRIPIYMFFEPSERGRELKEIYDRGIEQILANGEYLQIYYKYDKRFFSSQDGELAVKQIKTLFPDLPVPEQKKLVR